MSATLSAKARDAYLDLVRAFPLRVIRNEDEAAAANDILLKLVMSKRKMKPGQREYAETLTALVRQYEMNRPRSELIHSSPLEILRHLMDETHMGVSDLGRVIGHQPTASQILRGERELSKSHIQRLADYFRVSTDLFMDRNKTNYRRAS